MTLNYTRPQLASDKSQGKDGNLSSQQKEALARVTNSTLLSDTFAAFTGREYSSQIPGRVRRPE